MTTAPWQQSNDTMAMASSPAHHRNGYMAMNILQWHYDTWQHVNGDMAIATWQ